MPKGDIRLSPKYGVNPSLSQCFFCGGDKNEIILPGRITRKTKNVRYRAGNDPSEYDYDSDVEAPRKCVWNMEPCDTCKDYMKQGILCMSIDPTKSKDHLNPYRTGGWIVIKEEVIPRLINNPKLVEQITKARFVFIEDEVWDGVGFPRGEIKTDKEKPDAT